MDELTAKIIPLSRIVNIKGLGSGDFIAIEHDGDRVVIERDIAKDSYKIRLVKFGQRISDGYGFEFPMAGLETANERFQQDKEIRG